MGSDSTKQIEAWFTKHCDDGEFMYPTRKVTYSVIWPANGATRIVVTTKPAVVSVAIQGCEAPDSFGMIGRRGLPTATDVHWFRELSGPHDLLFLGDMDPVDLMIFAWLRAHLHPKRIVYLGVGDAFLRLLNVSVDDSFWIPCTLSENQGIALLEDVFADCYETIGPECAGRLKGGYKIEIEALVSAAGSAAALLRPGTLCEI